MQLKIIPKTLLKRITYVFFPCEDLNIEAAASVFKKFVHSDLIFNSNQIFIFLEHVFYQMIILKNKFKVIFLKNKKYFVSYPTCHHKYTKAIQGKKLSQINCFKIIFHIPKNTVV